MNQLVQLKRITSTLPTFTLRQSVVLLAALFVAVVSAHAQTLEVLHTFTARPDGLTPDASVILDQDGNLYGTTARGGAGLQGTVFKIDTNGNETVLHSFVRRPDGLDPEAGLAIDDAGNLYGTTQAGGSQGKGTVFKIDTNGTETILHNFTCCPALGRNPVAGVIVDGFGNLYGTASNGGDQAQDGTVFKLSPSGEVTLLHFFNARDGDGRNPLATLFMDLNGNLYGTTYQGGTQDQGIVFKIDNALHEYSVLYRFGGGADGKWPRGGVIMDQDGNLFGTTSGGGANNGGTVFKIDINGNKTVLHSFGARRDGQQPWGGLAIDGDGNLYGTTLMGGANNGGTVFKIDNGGQYSVLYSFRKSDGTSPAAGVIWSGSGNLYGTTSQGGPGNGSGTVFKLSLP